MCLTCNGKNCSNACFSIISLYGVGSSKNTVCLVLIGRDYVF